MRKWVAWVAVGAVVVAAVVGLARASSTRSGDTSAGGSRARVERRDLTTYVKATGVLRPMVGAEVRVGSRVSGVVSRLFVRIGDPVSRGQLLAELDGRELGARRAQTVAALESARASLRYARADLERKRQLARESLLPASELDLAERAAAVAATQADEAEASLEGATTQLDYTRIRAPIAGLVASISTQEGETVAASFASPTFVTLLDLDRLELRTYVDETDIGRIRAGQEARFTVDTYPGHELEGRVATVYPQAEIRDNVVNYVTVVRFEPPRDRQLRPEMTATVRIALETRPGALALPRQAVRRDGARSFVVAPDGGARRFVTTGARDDTHVEIREGLREGDEAVVAGISPGGADAR